VLRAEVVYVTIDEPEQARGSPKLHRHHRSFVLAAIQLRRRVPAVLVEDEVAPWSKTKVMIGRSKGDKHIGGAAWRSSESTLVWNLPTLCVHLSGFPERFSLCVISVLSTYRSCRENSSSSAYLLRSLLLRHSPLHEYFFYFRKIVLYNSLSHARQEIVRLHVSSPHVVVRDFKGKAASAQVSPFFPAKDSVSDSVFVVSDCESR